MDDTTYGVSEIESITSTRFLVDERDGKFANDPTGPSVQKKLYMIDVRGATDISDPANARITLPVKRGVAGSANSQGRGAAGVSCAPSINC